MTVTQLVQLYAPLAGLLAVAFWLGILTQRVSTLEREERDRKDRDRSEQNDRDRIVRLETKVDALTDTLASVNRELGSIQRALANLASGRSPIIKVPETD